MTTTAPHLTRETSDRGLNYLPSIPGRHGGPDGELSVYTSSAASGPHLWIRSEGSDGSEATRHVTAANALRFADRVAAIHREVAAMLLLVGAEGPGGAGQP